MNIDFNASVCEDQMLRDNETPRIRREKVLDKVKRSIIFVLSLLMLISAFLPIVTYTYPIGQSATDPTKNIIVTVRIRGIDLLKIFYDHTVKVPEEELSSSMVYKEYAEFKKENGDIYLGSTDDSEVTTEYIVLFLRMQGKSKGNTALNGEATVLSDGYVWLAASALVYVLFLIMGAVQLARAILVFLGCFVKKFSGEAFLSGAVISVIALQITFFTFYLFGKNAMHYMSLSNFFGGALFSNDLALPGIGSVLMAVYFIASALAFVAFRFIDGNKSKPKVIRCVLNGVYIAVCVAVILLAGMPIIRSGYDTEHADEPLTENTGNIFDTSYEESSTACDFAVLLHLSGDRLESLRYYSGLDEEKQASVLYDKYKSTVKLQGGTNVLYYSAIASGGTAPYFAIALSSVFEILLVGTALGGIASVLSELACGDKKSRCVRMVNKISLLIAAVLFVGSVILFVLCAYLGFMKIEASYDVSITVSAVAVLVLAIAQMFLPNSSGTIPDDTP